MEGRMDSLRAVLLIFFFNVSSASISNFLLQHDACLITDFNSDTIKCKFLKQGFYYSEQVNHVVKKISFDRFTDSILLKDKLKTFEHLVVKDVIFDHRYPCEMVNTNEHRIVWRFFQVTINERSPLNCTLCLLFLHFMESILCIVKC